MGVLEIKGSCDLLSLLVLRKKIIINTKQTPPIKKY